MISIRTDSLERDGSRIIINRIVDNPITPIIRNRDWLVANSIEKFVRKVRLSTITWSSENPMTSRIHLIDVFAVLSNEEKYWFMLARVATF